MKLGLDRRLTKFSQRPRMLAERPTKVLSTSMSVLTKMTVDERPLYRFFMVTFDWQGIFQNGFLIYKQGMPAF